LRFAVHWPGCPVASPRSHGVPRRDVPGRIDVSVAGETAGIAPEGGLALARTPVHVPTGRAALAGKSWPYLLHPTRRFVFQTANKQTPAGSQYLPVEAGFGANVSAWIPRSAPRRAGHSVDPEVLYADHVETPSDVRGGFLYPVLAPVRLTGPQPGNHAPDPCAAVRALPCASQFPLESGQSLLLARGEPRGMQRLPCRQGSADGHASINSNCFAVTWCRDRIGNNRECDMPAPGLVHRHPIRLDTRRHRARPAEPHPADLRNPDFTGFQAQSPHMRELDGHDPEAFIPPGLPPRWAPGRVIRVEVGIYSLGEVPQGLLLNHLRPRSQPRLLSPSMRELPTLLQIARSTLAIGLPVGMLLNGQVPHVAGVRAVASKHCLLGGRGLQPVSRHTNTLAKPTDISEGGEAAFPPRLETGTTAPRP
jgi:hypothetical protein